MNMDPICNAMVAKLGESKSHKPLTCKSMKKNLKSGRPA